METFELDDGRRDEGAVRPIWRRLFPRLPRFPRSWLSAIAFPFHVLAALTRFVFNILRLPVPQLRLTYLQLFRGSLAGHFSPSLRRGADWWVRALEEETGAVCIGRARNGGRRATAVSGVNPGPSSLTPRFGNNDEHVAIMTDNSTDTNGSNGNGNRKLLPDFSLESYEDVLRMCETEARIACIVLVCEEHDDVAEFKRTTLTDSTFVQTLYENNIIVWGGDVRSQDAWSASQKLQATTYPFVAFLALQPSRHADFYSNTSSPKLVVLSRHQGPSVPTTSPTSPQSLIEHLQQQLLPRVKPFLERLRTLQRERDQERILREEQDRAFRDSARKDREKIVAKMASEKQEAEAKRARERARQLEEARRQQEIEDAQKRELARMEWRRWTRRALIPPDVQKSSSKEVVRIALRLPGDRQSRRQFAPTATLTTLYAFVDAQLIPSDISPAEDPDTSPAGSSSKDPLQILEDHIVSSNQSADKWWGFKLVFAYPRQEINWEVGRRLCDVEVLKGGGQIMVEMIEHQGRPAHLSDDDDSDDGDS